MRAGPQLSGRDRCQLLLWQGEEHPFWRKHVSPGIGRVNGGESLPCEKVARPAVAGEPGLPARHGLCRPTPTPVSVQWDGISSRWPSHFGSSRFTTTRLSELTLRPRKPKPHSQPNPTDVEDVFSVGKPGARRFPRPLP